MSTTSLAQASFTFPRGVHPPENKSAAEHVPVEVLPSPAEVRIPLLQHLGAPCQAVVKAKDAVAVGDKVGEASGFVSAPVHSSVAGTVTRARSVTLPNGRRVPSIPIQAAEDQPLAGAALFDDVFGGDWPMEGADRLEPGRIADAAKNAGLVGLGGAAFPTHVKLARNDAKPIEWLMLNGCECEPYLTSDYRLMVEAPRPVISGAILAARAVGAAKVAVCVEDNKPEAIDRLAEAAAGTPVEIRVMKTKYPQGGERQLIYAALRRAVPVGGLPLDVGVVVMNVGTSAALARAVWREKPLTHRIVSVSGGGIAQAKNLLVPIGVSYQALVDYCGGLNPQASRIVAGGPMMGFTLGSLDTPVTKGTSGITVLTEAECRHAAETNCVRCGRCVDVCPQRLVPTKLALSSRAGALDLLERYSIGACIECGSCAYVCPASLPLVQLIRAGKTALRKKQSK